MPVGISHSQVYPSISLVSPNSLPSANYIKAQMGTIASSRSILYPLDQYRIDMAQYNNTLLAEIVLEVVIEITLSCVVRFRSADAIF